MYLAFLARSNKWREGLFAAALACSALSGGGFAAAAEGDGDPCVEEWLPGFGEPGFNGTVLATTTWDADGSGPQPAQLVAGGFFTTAGGVVVNFIARWDGSAWQPFGSGMDGAVLSLTTWDPDGSGPQPAQLVAGGLFTTAGGVTVNRIARWDGSAWQPFGTGIGSEFEFGVVYSLSTWDPDGSGPQPAQLVAGGQFTTAGGVVVNYIARWDGSDWLPFGTGTGGSFPDVRALTTWDPDGSGPQPAQLVAGGFFTTAGGVTVNRIARWDGSAWQPFGTGMNGSVGALTTWNSDSSGPQPAQLVAGGQFTTAGGVVAANYIARWDGSAWQPFGTGMAGGEFITLVDALTTWDPDDGGPQLAQLVSGGDFTIAGGVVSSRIAFWGCPDGVPCLRGDANGDDAVDFNDIDCFVSALVGESTWLSCAAGLDAATFTCANDCTCDGTVDFDDIDCFVQCLVVGECPPCP